MFFQKLLDFAFKYKFGLARNDFAIQMKNVFPKLLDFAFKYKFEPCAEWFWVLNKNLCIIF